MGGYEGSNYLCCCSLRENLNLQTGFGEDTIECLLIFAILELLLVVLFKYKSLIHLGEVLWLLL